MTPEIQSPADSGFCTSMLCEEVFRKLKKKCAGKLKKCAGKLKNVCRKNKMCKKCKKVLLEMEKVRQIDHACHVTSLTSEHTLSYLIFEKMEKK